MKELLITCLVLSTLLISVLGDCVDKKYYANYNGNIHQASLEIDCAQGISFAELDIRTLKLQDVTLSGASDRMLSGGGYTANILSLQDDKVEVQVNLDKTFNLDLYTVDDTFCKNETLYFVSEMCNTIMEYTSDVTVICHDTTFDIVYEDNSMEHPVVSTHYKIKEDKYKIFYQDSPVGSISFTHPSMNVTIAEDCEFSLFEECKNSELCTKGCSETNFYLNPFLESDELVTAGLNISCSQGKYDVIYTKKEGKDEAIWRGKGGLQGRYIARGPSSFNSVTFKGNRAFAAYYENDPNPKKTYTLEIPISYCENKTYDLVSKRCINEGRVEGVLDIICHGNQFEMIFTSSFINERYMYHNIPSEYYYFPQTGSSSKWLFSLKENEVTVAMFLKNADYSCNFTVPVETSESESEGETTDIISCDQECGSEGATLCTIYCEANRNPLYYVGAASVLAVIIVLITVLCCCCCKKKNQAAFNYELTNAY